MVRPQILCVDRKKSGLKLSNIRYRYCDVIAGNFLGIGGEGIIFGFYMGFYRTPFLYENDRAGIYNTH